MQEFLQDFPFFPRSASTMSGQVDALYFAWALIAVFFSTLIAALILFFMVRYRRRGESEIGQVESRSLPLEITWAVIPLAICLAMFAWGATIFIELRRPPADALEYFAFGKQWMWKFQHPDGRREINDLHVPVGVPIKLTMTSEDVIHSFFVPAFRVKSDVLPGRYTTVWFEATRTGDYHLFCAEYCGAEHSLMGGTVTVMEQHDYEEWLAARPAGISTVSAGERLFVDKACHTCHERGDSSRGPALVGLFGSEVELASGETVLADETYIRSSILDPADQIVAGFQPLMPTYRGQIDEEQLVTIVGYLKSLAGSDSRLDSTVPAESSAATGGSP